VRVPIGWIDLGAHPTTSTSTRRVWLGGDVLAPLHVLAAIAAEREIVGDVAIEGATLGDLKDAVRGAGGPVTTYCAFGAE
jgi:hypothetical protein